MTKKIIYTAIILLLIGLNIKIYFHSGFPYTHDGENHLARFANYKIAIKEKQIPPRFAPNLMNHYGYPVFNYNYPLANILSLPFSIFKINYELIFKIIASFFVGLGILGIFKWSSDLSRSSVAGIWSAIVFATTPFLISTLAYRGNIGEIMALGILPWILVAIEKISSNQVKIGNLFWLVAIVLWTSLALAHNVTFVFAVPLLLIYAVGKLQKSFHHWLVFGSILSLSCLLSLWFWLPALVEQSEIVVGNASLSKTFADHFITLSQLLFSPLSFGFSYPGPIDSLGFNLGPIQVMVLLLASLYLIKKIFLHKFDFKNDRLWLSLVIVSWWLFFLQLSASHQLWSFLSMLRFIQFPWRLNIFLMITIAALSGYLYLLIPKRFKISLIIFALIQTIMIFKVKPADYFHRDNLTYESFGQSTSTANENLPRSWQYLDIGDWQPTPFILHGTGLVKVKEWRGSSRSYELDVQEKSVIVEPTMKFLGWETQVFQNGQHFKVNYIDDQKIAGRLAYELNPGNYEIKSSFTQNTTARMIGNTAAIATLFLTGAIFIVKKTKI